MTTKAQQYIEEIVALMNWAPNMPADELEREKDDARKRIDADLQRWLPDWLYKLWNEEVTQ